MKKKIRGHGRQQTQWKKQKKVKKTPYSPWGMK